MVKTIVTTEMVKAVSESFGAELIDVLTGFKFIGEKIKEFETEGRPERFLFGLEESYGYLKGTYASDLEQNDARLGILRTKDFENFERVCTGSELGNRNGALFPEKFDNLYFRLDRPFGNELEPCSMWMSFSPDLVYWGNSRPVMYKGKPFKGGFKMGAGAVPIKTDKGWLEIYHTVSTTCNGCIYRLKACLLDLNEPWNVIGHTDFILWPEHDYENRGRVSNVVFTCNAIPETITTMKEYL